MNYKIYIIIVTYNGERWIQRCLSQLYESTYPFKCIVVDNNSIDNTIDVIKKKYPEVYIISSLKNVGFGKANNIGIRYAINAGADGVFLLNQDAYIDDNTLAELMSHFDEHYLLSPMQYRGDGLAIDYAFHWYLDLYAPKYFEDVKDGLVKNSYDMNFANAAAWLIPSKMIREIGLFDPLFDHYGEDENYAQRLQHKGYKIKLIPSARICHDREQNVQRNKDYKYLKTFMLVSSLNPTKHESEIIEFKLTYWIKLFCYALLDCLCGKAQQSRDKLRLILYFHNHKEVLRSHRKGYQSSGSFL